MPFIMKSLFIALLVIILVPSVLFSSDWPMWRFDAERSGSSPECLHQELSLKWSLKLPPVRPAWPHDQTGPRAQNRLGFDASYEPIVMGNLAFIGSPNDGSVTAYDTETGVEEWKFFAEGPVRCAPAGWNDRLFVGSDDGYLYCLRAKDGELLWKFRGAPEERPDRWHLGNGQLISFWPVRGGPVVVDGTVYFGCGVWTINGVFVYALSAETGETVWGNDRLDNIDNVRSHHEMLHNDGVSPQGHLVAIENSLIVPSGRSLPAGLDLQTGDLRYWVKGFHHGDSRVAAHLNFAFVGADAVVNTHDFREIGSRWSYSGPEGPEGYNARWGHNHVGNPHRADMGEAPWAPYKFVEACDVDAAFHDGGAYGMSDGTFFAYDLNRARHVDKTQTVRERQVEIWNWEPWLKWSLDTGITGTSSPVIRAGDRIYGATENTLFAVEHLAENPAVVWEKEVKGKPTSLIAADGKLIVTTAEGWIHCYGKVDEGHAPGIFEGKEEADLRGGTDGNKGNALLKASGISEGYALVLGLEEGALIEELLELTDLYLIAVDQDAQIINEMRRRYSGTGLLGTRLQFITGNPLGFHFPPYLASLIVSERIVDEAFPFEAAAGTLVNILRPYGGTLCMVVPPEHESALASWADSAGEHAEYRRDSGISMLVRENALPGAGAWSHDPSDPARSYRANDHRVRAPLGVLWYGDVEMSHGAGRYWKDRPLVNQGQVFVNLSQSHPRIMSYDAYTGRFLWQTSIPSKTRGYGAAAMEDGFFVATDGKCVILDLADGSVRATYEFSASDTVTVKEIRVEDDVIVIAFVAEVVSGSLGEDACTLVCLDRDTGKELWRRKAGFRFSIHSIVLGDGKVFFVDALPMTASSSDARRGAWNHLLNQKEREATVFSLDMRSGHEVWSKTVKYENETDLEGPRRQFGSVADWLAYSADNGILLGGRLDKVNAWDALSGEALWASGLQGSRPGRNFTMPIILHGSHYFSQHNHPELEEYEISTGQPTGRSLQGTHIGCNHYLGGEHLLAIRDGSASYFDIATGKQYHLINVRSGCQNTLIQGDGMLNAPWPNGHTCRCSYSFHASSALVHMPEVEGWRSAEPFPMRAPDAPSEIP